MDQSYDYSKLIGFYIVKGEVFVKRHLLRLFQENGYDLTFEQWTVLNVIFADPGSIQSEIADKTFKDRTNVTRILDILAKRGLITRTRDEKDRRVYRLYLTEKGISLFDELVPLVQRANNTFSNGITESDMEVFYKVLDRICGNVG